MSRMPKRLRGQSEERAYISLGGGVRLASEDYFLRIFGPLGMSRRGFRSFCTALRVPMIHVGRTRLVEITTFRLAMRAVTRIGKKDFLAAGCIALESGDKPPQHVVALDLHAFEKEWEQIVGELLVMRKLTGTKNPTTYNLSKVSYTAALRIMAFAAQIRATQEQEGYDAEAKAAATEVINAPEHTG